MEDECPKYCPIRTNLDLTLSEFRHTTFLELIKQKGAKKVLDLGTSEGELLRLLGRSPQLQLLVGIDLDKDAANRAVSNACPQGIQSSIRFMRNKDLIIKVYQGSILEHYQEVKREEFDIVSLIEVIQHLPLEAIPKANQTIFGFIRPQWVVITTPNREFNDHFGDKKGKFRHWDHKFEWDREEFKQYCHSVKDQYGYDFQISGLGQHFSDNSKGSCTQMAVFTKNTNFKYTYCSVEKQIVEAKQQPIPLTLAASYTSYCWKSQLELIIKKLFDDGLSGEEHQIFEELINYSKSTSLLGQCLAKQGINFDVKYLQEQIAKFEGVYQWDQEKYWRKYVEPSQSEESSQEVGYYQISNEEAGFSYAHHLQSQMSDHYNSSSV